VKKAFCLWVLLFIFLISISAVAEENSVVDSTVVPALSSLEQVFHPKTYPQNINEEYYRFATTPPDHLFTTLGSENKLEGTIYTIKGTLESSEIMDVGGIAIPTAIIQTKHGPVLFLNFYKGIYAATATAYGESTAAGLYSDNPEDYFFPEQGEFAELVGIYSGYSQTLEMPVFYFGASKSLFLMVSYQDPVPKK